MPRPRREVIRQAEKIADWFETEGPSPENEVPVAEYFLGLLADMRSLGEDEIRGAVELARGGGASWRQIGEVLGISSSEAERQFDSAAIGSTPRHRDVESLGLDL
ncbi:MAG: hypothetical protein OXC06_13775 [Acidimicrobiaceae bacterium]|nr:hypothetical protein [Acidimicrobiaceae bacterium]